MLTKLAMAKVVITALYNMPELVTEDNKVRYAEAVKMSKRMKKSEIEERYTLAHSILTKRVSEECRRENPDIYINKE